MAKKRIQYEIKLIIIMAVLSVIFFGLTFGIKAAESHENDETQAYIDMAVMEEIPDSIEVSAKDGTFTLLREKSEWYCEGRKDLPIASLKVTDTRTVLKYFEPGRVLKESRENWEKFGLNDPACTLRVTSSEKQNTYLIGNYNPVTGEYYVALEGADLVYMVPKSGGDTLMMGLLDYVKDPEISEAELGNIAGIRVEADDLLYNIDLENGRYMVRTSEEGFETDQASVMNIFNCFTSRGYECVSIDPDGDVLKNYGLDSPVASVFFKESEDRAEYDMFIGHGKDGGYYITSGAKDLVYRFDEDRYSNLINNIKIETLKGGV